MKWQYHVVQFPMASRNNLMNALYNLGQQQWELVNVITEELDQSGQVLTLFFKKPA